MPSVMGKWIGACLKCHVLINYFKGSPPKPVGRGEVNLFRKYLGPLECYTLRENFNAILTSLYYKTFNLLVDTDFV